MDWIEWMWKVDVDVDVDVDVESGKWRGSGSHIWIPEEVGAPNYVHNRRQWARKSPGHV